MPATRKDLPFDLVETYGQNPIRAETFLLQNEASGRIGEGDARVRLLTDFIFVKDGKFVIPNYESCTKDFWKGVELWGFMMCPTTRGKWFAWSLLWHLDWPGKHMELVRITGIDGMSKEPNAFYRNGNQVTLWANSTKGFAYALMEPEEQIAEQWALVLDSWNQTSKNKGPVPICEPVVSLDKPPGWWHGEKQSTGMHEWTRLVKLQKKYLADKKEADEGPETPPPTTAASTKKRKDREERAEERELGSETRAARGTGTDETPGPHQEPVTQQQVEASSSDSTAHRVDLASQNTSVEVRLGPDGKAASTGSKNMPYSKSPSPKRPRTMAPSGHASTSTPPAGPITQILSAGIRQPPDFSAGSSRMQAEKSPPPARASGSIPSHEEASPPHTHPASQGSQLARQVKELSMGANDENEIMQEWIDATFEVQAAAPEHIAPTIVPAAAELERADVPRSGSSVPTVAPVLSVTSASESPAQASPMASVDKIIAPSVSAAAPTPSVNPATETTAEASSATPADPTIVPGVSPAAPTPTSVPAPILPAQAPHVTLNNLASTMLAQPPQGLAPGPGHQDAVGISEASVADSSDAHIVTPLPGGVNSNASSLDHRSSSFRRQGKGPA